MFIKFKNIIKYFLRYCPQCISKYINIIWHNLTIHKSKKWASKQSICPFKYMYFSDKFLYEKALIAKDKLSSASKVLDSVPFEQGGGGAYSLLYFLILKHKPTNILETGVAAGWSSFSILQAIEDNGFGRLYSSDLPYINDFESQKYVGILVPEHFKKNWNLCIEGDNHCIPKFIEDSSFHFFHYDSAKSYSARNWCWDKVSDSLVNNAIVIFDDIQDNFYFRDLVTKLNTKYQIFEFEGKYVGCFIYEK